MSEYIIEMKDIRKQFGDVQAVSKGQFNLIEGEVHALIGENGAGKSTMMKLLYGMYALTAGEIIYQGERLEDYTTAQAIELQIGMVHQEFMLIDDFTVLENIILGSEPTKGLQIDYKQAEKEIQQLIDEYNLQIDLKKKVSQISVGEAQRAEIVKVLWKGANVIILDEPTAVLTPQEVEALFAILRNLKADGKSIIFISHIMDQVLEISDRISVMKRGEYVGTIDRDEANYKLLSEMMIGREVFLDIEKEPKNHQQDEKVLCVNNIWVPGEKEASKLRDVSFYVKKGEILGLAGIDGNGQLELEEAIAGLRQVEQGSILINEQDVTNQAPDDIRNVGLNYIPANRNHTGLNRHMSIEDNLLAGVLQDEHFSKYSFIQEEAAREHALTLIDKYDIRPKNPDLLTGQQSGGNAQKVVVARETYAASDILVASHPTRGIDIGSIEFIRKILIEASEQGVGVLLISAELSEILSLSDRILVMFEGKIVADLLPEEATEEKLGMYMMGGKLSEYAEIEEELTVENEQ